MAANVTQLRRAAAAAGCSRPSTPLVPAPRLLQRRHLQRRALHAAAAAAAAGSSSSSSTLPKEADVVVVGAGLAGLNAAATLCRAGLRPLVLEASDGVGGRARTDELDGFLLDRGFQIFLTGYPEAAATLDLDALRLSPFYAGARVRYAGAWHTVADPLRHFADGLASLTNPIGSVGDKINVGLFRLKTLLGPLDAIYSRPETTTLARLQAEGFSPAIIDRFFRPFLGGIFFNSELTVSSRLFEFVMRMLATGQNCLPAEGIGAMAAQLAGRLPTGTVVTGAQVQRVAGARAGAPAQVQLADGQTVAAAKGVVVAVEGPEAWRLLGEAMDAAPSKSEPGVGTACVYFSAPAPPFPDAILYLNGDGTGIVNNCCFPSTVAPSYAPPGQTLVSVSVIGTQPQLSEGQLVEAVKREMAAWFGPDQVATWSHLRTYRIPFAQPNQSPPTNFSRPVALGCGLFVAGDHRDSATFDAALRSGRRAAEALLAEAGAAGSAAAPAAAVTAGSKA